MLKYFRTYLPSKVEEVIEIWNKQIEEEDKNNRTTMKIISPINKHNEESLTLTENLFKEFYAGLDDEKNKLNQGNINNFQGFDFFKEINDGKKVKLDDVIGAKIETKKIIEEKSSKTEEDKKEEKVEKKPGEEEEDEGEDDEEGGEEDDNEENK